MKIRKKFHKRIGIPRWASRAKLRFERKWYILKQWQRVLSASLAGLMLLAAVIPTAQFIIVSRSYILNDQVRQLIGEPNKNLSNKITFNSEKDSWQFNQGDIPIGTGNGTSGLQQADMPSENDLKAQVGGGGEKDKSLYAVDMPSKGADGVTYYDTNTDLSFSLVPKFSVGEGRNIDGHLVYPSEHGSKLVYTAKANGMKEDIVLTKSIGDDVAFSYDLKLPDTLEAKIQMDGSLGVYSPNPVLFGNISFGDGQDKEKIISARKTAAKDHLLFVIPAPVIVEAGGKPADTDAKFTLSGDTLTVSAHNMNNLKYPLSIDPSVVVTSSGDFATGSDDNIAYGTDQISRAGLTGGTIEAWASTATGTYTTRYLTASVAYNGYLYIIAGDDRNEVDYAPINSNGTIGAWNSTTALGANRTYPGAVAYNGYMYVFGGWTSGTSPRSDVVYAPINSNGTLGSWTTSSNAMATGACRFGFAQYNGYLYAVGGATGTVASTCGNSSTTKANTTQYAPIKANGDVGTWTTSATTFTNARMSPGVAAYNGKLYLTGGTVDGSTTYNTTHYATIKSDGDIDAWVAASNNLANTKYRFGMVAHNGYLYVSGGSSVDTATTYAPILANGDIGAWRTTSAMATGRYGHGFVAYKDYLYFTGGVSGTPTLLNDTGYAKINPAGTTRNFGTTATTFTTARALTCSVAYNGFLYAIGGSTSDNGANNVTTVRYTALDSSTGDTGTWNTTTALPEARGSAGCTAYNGYVYVIGGYTATNVAQNTVRYAPINTNGTIGTWVTTAPNLPQTKMRMGVFTYTTSSGTYLYSVGGDTTGSSSLVRQSYYALIGSSGSIGSWSTASNDMSLGYSYQAYAQVGKYIYAMGGWTISPSTAYSNVEYTTIQSNGDLGTWSSTTSMNTAVGFSNGTTVNGCIYAVGGEDSATTSLANVQYACPAANGTISTWYNAPNLTVATTDMGVTSYNGYIYGVGGYTTSVQATTQFTAVNNGGGGGTGTWGQQASSLGSSLYSHGFAYSNGYFYLIGGDNNGGGIGATTNTWYAPLNSDGSIGTWTSTSALNTARNSHATYISGGYMYVAGGIVVGGGKLSSAEYAPINSNGTLGTWSTATATLSSATGQQAFAAHNGYLYALGGTTGSLATTVYYANVSSGGNFSSWSTTTALPYGVRAASAVVNNGYLYVLGGIDSVGLTGKVIYAPINSNGTLGSWSYTSVVPTAGLTTPVAANGHMYATSIEGASCAGTTYRATILTDGSLGPFQQTVANNTCSYGNGSGAYVNGQIYVPIGNGSTWSTSVKSIARSSTYTKRINLGGGYALTSIAYGGTLPNGDLSNIRYRTATSNATFGSSQPATGLTGGPVTCANFVDTSYIHLRVRLDDTYTSAYPDANSSAATLTDMTVNYQSPRAETNQRLAHGKFFSGESLQGLDTCGS